MSVAGTTTLLLGASMGTGLAAAPGPIAVATISPAPGQVVGVAMPVTVTFAGPVADRAAAERSFSISSPHAPKGDFMWLKDDVVQWSPSSYWPAHSTIALSVGGAKTNFQAGASVVGVADLNAHTFTVSIDGEVARSMPASMGKPNHTTPIGSFTALEKQSPVIMDSRTIGIPLSDPEGYKLTVYDAVRVTWGGVYVHAAPWSVASQGNSNVSHGCINLSPDNAGWYYDQVSIGDPIIVQA
ncbi:L,D-transpeptidase [Mycobacterium hodleri]|uniref:L,D-transpeptidase n=2 Tax=Mycolicibacterium hodleri TaxID=49897 RepID=A0A502E7M3_9MYCO|nr:L,D-transpeptidase family protein [Mycolicibacterium hodleri]TPG33643.1 L,D-transpeptidase [Mycolicibacterium hodleri]